MSTDRANFAFHMVIVLTVFQFLTIVALILLWITFRELKKNVNTYKDSLPLVNITKPTPDFTLSVPSSSQSVSTGPVLSPPASMKPDPSPSPFLTNSGSIVGKTQQAEQNEEIEILPTPDPERRVQSPATVAIVTKPKRESTSKEHIFSSFTEFSRDSGIGSTSGRNQSTSSESMKYAIGKSYDSNPVFSGNVSVDGETRTESNSSRTSNSSKPKRYSFHDYQNALQSLQHVNDSVVSCNEYAEVNDININDNDDDEDDYRHLERLQTMAIEMIDIDTKTSARDKRKRASQILNELALEADSNGRVSFVNRGYSDASVTSQSRAPLASEECSLVSDAHNVDENDNDVIEDEVYENQEIIDKHRLSVNMETTVNG